MTATDSTTTDTSPDGRRPGRGGPRRSRGPYDRRRRRETERWPAIARANAFLLRHPETILALLGERGPVEVEGRVLNRQVQALLAIGNRIERLGFQGALSGSIEDPEAMRRRLRRLAQVGMPVRTDVSVTGRVIPAAACPAGVDGIPVRVYRPFGEIPGIDDPSPGIVFFHGGGWVTGDLVSHDASCRLLAAVSRCVVVAVHYRRAPEHPFPAAIDDALAAYAWVHAEARALGVDGARVGVMGDSAGGNLAAAVALLAREGGPGEPTRATGAPGAALPPPVAQGLVYPAANAHLLPEVTHGPLSEGFFLTGSEMEMFIGAYLPDAADLDDPAVSPMLAADLSGLAPALVVTAGFDPLRYDGIAYARRLEEAGNQVVHLDCTDQIHGFFGMGVVEDALALSTEVCDAMGRLLRRGGRS